jgi:DNA-binding NtrC family response regulator
VPPLRERPEDILPLALYFLDHFNAKFGKEVGPLAPEAFAALEAAPWPGNVRELQHAIERAVAVKAAGPVSPADLGLGAPAAAAAAHAPAAPFREAREAFEREYFAGLIKAAGGNISEAARMSGIARQNFYAHIKRLGLVLDS